MSIFKRENKFTRSQADAQLEMLNEYYDVDLEFLIEPVRNAFEQHILGMTKSVMRGRLSIDEKDGGVIITQFLENAVDEYDKLEFGEINNKVALASERAEGVDKVYTIISGLSGVDMSTIKKLKRVDKSTSEDIGNYFLFV